MNIKIVRSALFCPKYANPTILMFIAPSNILFWRLNKKALLYRRDYHFKGSLIFCINKAAL